MARETRVPELESEEARRALALALTEVFEAWGIGVQEQQEALGIKDIAAWAACRRGEPLPRDPDLLQRVGHLLAIHRALKRRYVHDLFKRDSWMRMPIPELGGERPIDIVRREGSEGLVRIREHLRA